MSQWSQVSRIALLVIIVIFSVLSFLSDPGVPGVRSMGPVLCHKLTRRFADLTYVTLVDEDSKSIPTNNARCLVEN